MLRFGENRRSTADGQSSAVLSFCARSLTNFSKEDQSSGGSSNSVATKRLRKDSSELDMSSFTRIDNSSFMLRLTYISPTPSCSHAAETLKIRQISRIVRSLGCFFPEQTAEINEGVTHSFSAKSDFVQPKSLIRYAIRSLIVSKDHHLRS